MKGGSVSELSIAGQPHAWIFRALDILSGILFILLAILLAKRMADSRSRNFLVVTTAILGGASIFDGALPLRCSETLNSSCTIPVSFSWSHVIVPTHGYSSIIIAVSYFLLPLAGLIYAHRQSKAQFFKIVSFIAVVEALFSFSIAVAGYVAHHGYSLKALGPSQEFQMALLGIWFISWYLTVRSSKDEHHSD